MRAVADEARVPARALARRAFAGWGSFTTAEAQAEGKRLGLSPGTILVTLSGLAKGGWTLRLRRGLYATTGSPPGGIDVPAFAITTALVTPRAISHWSARGNHHLTDQIPAP